MMTKKKHIDVDSTWNGEGSLDDYRQEQFQLIEQPGFGNGDKPKPKPEDPAVDPVVDELPEIEEKT
jgi:hypothetical protein